MSFLPCEDHGKDIEFRADLEPTSVCLAMSFFFLYLANHYGINTCPKVVTIVI